MVTEELAQRDRQKTVTVWKCRNGCLRSMGQRLSIWILLLVQKLPAKQGGWNGGFAPYGYELIDGKLHIKEDEASIVELIFDKFVNGGMGYSTIAGYLNRQGIPKPPSRNSHGRKFVDWSVHHIKRMLNNLVYTGRISSLVD